MADNIEEVVELKQAFPVFNNKHHQWQQHQSTSKFDIFKEKYSTYNRYNKKL